MFSPRADRDVLVRSRVHGSRGSGCSPNAVKQSSRGNRGTSRTTWPSGSRTGNLSKRNTWLGKIYTKAATNMKMHSEMVCLRKGPRSYGSSSRIGEWSWFVQSEIWMEWSLDSWHFNWQMSCSRKMMQGMGSGAWTGLWPLGWNCEVKKICGLVYSSYIVFPIVGCFSA